MKTVSLTPCEAEVMDVVWAAAPVAVQDVVDRLARPLAYTTVMTTMKILEEKGVVAREGKRGRAFLYRPTVTREAVRHSMIRDLAQRLFGGSVKSLALSLVQNEKITPDDLREVRAVIDALEAE